MAAQQPRWRRAFDSMEEPLRKRLEAAAGSAEFARVLLLLLEGWTAVGKTTRAASTRLLHVANLPAYADLRRLSRQLGALESRVEKIATNLERLSDRLDGSGPRARRAK